MKGTSEQVLLTLRVLEHGGVQRSIASPNRAEISRGAAKDL